MDGVSGTVKGVTAAVVLGYGAPLPVMALVTFGLFPSKTFKHLATKINELFFSNYEKIDVVSCNEQTKGASNWLATLETTEYLISNSLALYQKVLPINWLQIMAVAIVERPLRWSHAEKLPDCYTKRFIGDWIWVLSGASGELLQSSKLLSNAFSSKVSRLNETKESYTYFRKEYSIPHKFLVTTSSNKLAINWMNNNNVIKGTTFIACLSVIGTSNILTLMLPWFFYSVESINYDVNVSCNVVNPVHDQIIDASSTYNYLIDAKQIFSADILYFTVKETNQQVLPTCMILDRTIASMIMNDSVYSITITEKVLYVVTNSRLQLINISDASNPVILGGLDVVGGHGLVNSIAVAGNIAYIAAGLSGLEIINVSNVYSPVKIANVIADIFTSGVEVLGEVAYVTTSSDLELIANVTMRPTMHLINISKPSNPMKLATVITNDVSFEVVVVGDMAYVAAGVSGLQIINVSNVYSPVKTATLTINNSYAFGVTVVKEVAYLVTHLGLYIVSIRNVSNPIILSSMTTNYFINDITIVDEMAYLVAAEPAGLYIFNVSNSQNPLLLETYHTPKLIYINSVAVIDSTVFIGTDSGLQILSLIEGQIKSDSSCLKSTYFLTVTGFNGQRCSITNNFKIILEDGNLGIITPILDQVAVVNVEYNYLIDSKQIFSGNIQYFTVTETNKLILPSMLSIQRDVGSIIIGDSTTFTTGVVIICKVAYVGYIVENVKSGFQIINISDTKYPTKLGNVDMSSTGLVHGIAVHEEIAYVATDIGLQLINISNPNNPTKLGLAHTGDNNVAKAIYIEGEIAYVTTDYLGLQLINISDSHNPVILGSVGTLNAYAAHSYGVKVMGEVAYIALNSGLQLINISNARNPVPITILNIPTLTYGVEVIGETAYITTDLGLQLVNISNCKNLTLLGTMTTSKVAHGIVVVGDRAYVSVYTVGLHIIDISNPNKPILLEIYNTAGLTPSNVAGIRPVNNVAVVNSTVFVGGVGLSILSLEQGILKGVFHSIYKKYSLTVTGFDYSGKKVVDIFKLSIRQEISSIYDPVLLGKHSVFPQQTISLSLHSNKLFHGQEEGLLSLFATLKDDKKLPTWLTLTLTPNLVGTYKTIFSSANDVTVVGTTAYIADNQGLQIIDISNIAVPTLIGNYRTLDFAMQVTVIDVIAYLAVNPTGVLAINISDPTKLTLLGNYPVLGIKKIIDYTESTILIAGTKGLEIVNVNYVVNYQLSKIESDVTFFEIKVIGEIAYIAGWSKGLILIDISNSNNPILIKNVLTQGLAIGIDVVGDIAYMATSFGLELIDLSNIKTPTLLETTSTCCGSAVAVRVIGDVAYVTAGLNLKLINISNIGDLVQLGEVIIGDLSTKIIIADKVAYVAARFCLQLVNVSNANSPTLLGSWIIGSTTIGLEVVEEIAYVTSLNGLQLINTSNVNNLTLLGHVSIQAVSITIMEKTAFVGTGAGIQLIDISDSRNLVFLGSADITSPAIRVINIREVLYVTTSVGLYIFNASLMKNMPPRRYITEHPVRDISIIDTTIFILTSDVWLQIIELSNLYNPVFLGNYGVGLLNGNSLAVMDNLAVIADLNLGLHIINISNLDKPAMLASYSTLGLAENIVVVGKLIFLAETTGLQIIDINNATMPTLIGNYPKENIKGIRVVGSTVYMAAASLGLQIIDCSSWIFLVNTNITDVGNYDLVLNALDAVGDKGTYDPFQIRVEGPPQINSLISLQYAKVGRSFYYFIPQGIFFDPNFDTLFFDARLNNAPLPAWLNFNGISAIFAGIPPEMGKVNLTIVSSATDNIAGSTTMVFGLYVDHIPQLNILVPDQVAGVNVSYDFTLNPNTFNDLDDDTLYYTLKLKNGLLLPNWINFDSKTHTFSGIPTKNDIGVYTIQIIVNDPYPDGEVSTFFNLLVENFPIVINAIPSQLLGVGKPFIYTIPINSFNYENMWQLTYIAELASGFQLPNWLTWQATLLQLKGIPTSTDKGTFPIKIIAKDPYGGTASSIFNLTVQQFPILTSSLSTVMAREKKNFTILFPRDTFIDPDARKLDYNITLYNGAQMPSWLLFNSSSLAFSGIPPSSGDISLLLTAFLIDNINIYSSTNFVLHVAPNYVPIINNPINCPLAYVGKLFQYPIPNDAFIDPNIGGILIYSVQMPIPEWLNFDPTARTFLGTPGKEDVDFYRDRVSYITLVATDEPLSATTTVKITVTGESWGQTIISIAGPAITIFTTIFAIYTNRALFLNYLNKQKYKREEEVIRVVGEFFDPIPVNVSINKVAYIEAVKQLFFPWYKFWLNSKLLPGGVLLPHWVEYNTSKNVLQIRGVGPTNKDAGAFVIRVKDGHKIIQEEFRLIILASNCNKLAYQERPTKIIVSVNKGFFEPTSIQLVALVKELSQIQMTQQVKIPWYKFWGCSSIPIPGSILPNWLEYYKDNNTLRFKEENLSGLDIGSFSVTIIDKHKVSIEDKFKLEVRCIVTAEERFDPIKINHTANIRSFRKVAVPFYRFWQSKYLPMTDEQLLPYWLQHNKIDNILQISNDCNYLPNDIEGNWYTIQISDNSGKLQKEGTLQVWNKKWDKKHYQQQCDRVDVTSQGRYIQLGTKIIDLDKQIKVLGDIKKVKWYNFWKRKVILKKPDWLSYNQDSNTLSILNSDWCGIDSDMSLTIQIKSEYGIVQEEFTLIKTTTRAIIDEDDQEELLSKTAQNLIPDIDVEQGLKISSISEGELPGSGSSGSGGVANVSADLADRRNIFPSFFVDSSRRNSRAPFMGREGSSLDEESPATSSKIEASFRGRTSVVSSGNVNIRTTDSMIEPTDSIIGMLPPNDESEAVQRFPAARLRFR